MTAPPASEPESLIRTELATGLDGPFTPEASRIAAYLAEVFGGGTIAIIHYGSQAQGSDAKPESAYDFFVVVERYGNAFRSLRAAIATRFTATTATILAGVLPPNIVAITAKFPDGTTRSLKCAVYSARDFARAISSRAQDHFAQGRLFQSVQLVWAKGPAERSRVREQLITIRERTWAWGGPFLPDRFDAAAYLRTMLVTSFAGEIRPESAERINVLLAAQRHVLEPAYDALLRLLVERGEVRQLSPGAYSRVKPATAAQRRRVKRYFRRSKVRATARWSKYVALYDDWLGYIVRKIERRSGQTMELTDRERRWPLVFLWPRAVRFLVSRDQRRPGSGS